MANSKFVAILPRASFGPQLWSCCPEAGSDVGFVTSGATTLRDLLSVSASPCPERLISLGCFRPQSPLLHGTDPIAFLDRCEQKAAIWSVACPQAANQEVPSANRGPFVVWVLVLTSERYRVRAALTVSRATVPALQDG